MAELGARVETSVREELEELRREVTRHDYLYHTLDAPELPTPSTTASSTA